LGIRIQGNDREYFEEKIENDTLFIDDIALVAPFIALPTAILACIA